MKLLLGLVCVFLIYVFLMYAVKAEQRSSSFKEEQFFSSPTRSLFLICDIVAFFFGSSSVAETISDCTFSVNH